MKVFFLFLFYISVIFSTFGQDNYPVPPRNENTLFYIQHSNNHNTYMYEAKLIGLNFDINNPVDSYRIVYTEGGKRKSLTEIQKKMAYGLDIKNTGVNLYEMYLAVSKDIKLNLFLSETGKPKVWVNIDNRKIILTRIFVQIKKESKSLKPDVENVIFEGDDFISGSKVKVIKKIK